MINVIKADIYNLTKPVDCIIVREKSAIDMVLKCSNYEGSKYMIMLPEIALDEDNAIEYLEFYKKAFEKAMSLDFNEIAIQAIDMYDEDFNYTLAKELYKVIKDCFKRYKVDIVIVCDDIEMKQIYEMAIFGEVKLPKVDIIDTLYFKDFVLIPTTNKAHKWEKKYKTLRATESKRLYFKCFTYPKLNKGEIAPISQDGKYFICMNMLKTEKKRNDTFLKAFEKGLQSVFDIMNTMCYKSITLPIVHFSPNKKENPDLIKKLVEEAYKQASEKEIEIKLYCPYLDLRMTVEEYLNELMGVVENAEE